jgi:hypothetical protein
MFEEAREWTPFCKVVLLTNVIRKQSAINYLVFIKSNELFDTLDVSLLDESVVANARFAAMYIQGRIVKGKL